MQLLLILGDFDRLAGAETLQRLGITLAGGLGNGVLLRLAAIEQPARDKASMLPHAPKRFQAALSAIVQGLRPARLAVDLSVLPDAAQVPTLFAQLHMFAEDILVAVPDGRQLPEIWSRTFGEDAFLSTKALGLETQLETVPELPSGIPLVLCRRWADGDAEFRAQIRNVVDRIRARQKDRAGTARLPPLPPRRIRRLKRGPFAPRNNIVGFDETLEGPQFPSADAKPNGGANQTVVIACMKNEGPYLLEWIAYHRMIGVDRFQVYSNGCEDGTDAMLSRLQELGHVEHIDNNNWKGQSPQQHALNLAMKSPSVRSAEWLIHIDADEFINIRCENGTLKDLRNAAPEATHFAMTWRLFGHAGVQAFEDAPVITQFQKCAPAFLPKPHTAWGFKTMGRNMGAYAKLSGHRPNKLSAEVAENVHWANGSGQEVTKAFLRNGWRSTIGTIGYDLVQLNHYALRSAEGFLVKRQRGRALHVDRKIGLNYWMRMDFNSCRDVTILRNLDRMNAEINRLKADPDLGRLHEAAVAWHRAKAEELRELPEFAALYDRAISLDMSDEERILHILDADVES